MRKRQNNLRRQKRGDIKITVGRHSGFCFGAKRAYDLACVISKKHNRLYVLGKMVHNDDVCRDLYKRGIKEVKSLSSAKDGIVIFTAHGVGPSLYERVAAKGMKIVDTTCPKVIKVQRLAKSYAKKGWQVFIFGDKNHKEVKGIKEWSSNMGKIVGNLKELKEIKFDKKKKYCLISQTTQNVQEFKKIQKYLEKQLPNFVFFNTICDSTDNRQNEIQKLAKTNDTVIVVGGKDSANSKRLWEIAKEINPKSYFIENEKDLKKEWLKNITSAAVSAGASTPEWVVKKVVDKIKNNT